jgi:hypothetical protein
VRCFRSFEPGSDIRLPGTRICCSICPATRRRPSLSHSLRAAATPIRLLDTQSREHIGRRLLHQQAGGELVEDLVWRWSSAPERYLDSALRLALASSPGVRPVDAGNAAVMAATLLAWQLESEGNPHLVGAVEVTITATDRTVRTQVIRASEPVSPELPDDLADAAGRLLHDLASESLTRATQALR